MDFASKKQKSVARHQLNAEAAAFVAPAGRPLSSEKAAEENDEQCIEKDGKNKH